MSFQLLQKTLNVNTLSMEELRSILSKTFGIEAYGSRRNADRTVVVEPIYRLRRYSPGLTPNLCLKARDK
jgi:hypothetical protein